MEMTLIKDLKPISKNVNLSFIVLEVSGRIPATKDALECRVCKVADRTASINFIIFGEIGNLVQPGDICRLIKADVGTWDGAMALYIGRGGELVKTGDFTMIFNENLNMSEINKIAKPNATSTTPATATSNNNPSQMIDVDS